MTAADSLDPSPPAAHRLWLWVKRLGIAGAIFVILLSAAAYFSRGWIAARSKEILMSELAKREIYAEFEEPRFTLTRGLVFTGVKLHRTAKKNHVLFSITDIAIAFNPLKFADEKGRTAWVTSRSADFIAHQTRQPTKVTNLDLDARIKPGRVVVDRLSGDATGVRLDLSGDFKSGGSAAKTERDPPKEKGLAALDLSPIGKFLGVIAAEPRDAPPLFRAHVVRLESGEIRANGSVSGKDFTWKGVDLDSVDLQFVTADDSSGASPGSPLAAVRIQSLDLGYGGGHLEASGSFAVKTRTLTIEKLRSGIDLLSFVSQISPDATRGLAFLRFPESPDISLTGTVPVADLAACNVSGTANASAAAVSLGRDKELQLSGVKADFTLAKGVLNVPQLSAATLGGQATASFSAGPFEKPFKMTTELALKDLSAQQVARLVDYLPGKEQAGSIAFTFKGGGVPSLAGLSGSGRLDMTNDNLVAVPLFRKLVPAFAKLISGFKENPTNTTLTSTYRLDHGILRSDDIRLEETAVAIDATAMIDFPRRQLEATANVETTGVSGLVTGIAGKALEMEGSGSFDDFDWRFKNIPNLKGISSLGNIDEAAGDVVNGGAEGVEKIGGGILKAAKGIIGGGKKGDGEKE